MSLINLRSASIEIINLSPDFFLNQGHSGTIIMWLNGIRIFAPQNKFITRTKVYRYRRAAFFEDPIKYGFT